MHTTNTRPLVISLLIILFVTGVVASLIAVISLTFPGSFLDAVLRLNPHAVEGFARMGRWSIVLMSMVCVVCLLTAIGLWRGSQWGYWLALVMLIGNLVGAVINVTAGSEKRAIVGIPIVLFLLIYLMRSGTRAYFAKSS